MTKTKNKACWEADSFDRLVLVEGKSQWENLNVENGAESVQADLIVDLNYNIRVIHD